MIKFTGWEYAKWVDVKEMSMSDRDKLQPHQIKDYVPSFLFRNKNTFKSTIKTQTKKITFKSQSNKSMSKTIKKTQSIQLLNIVAIDKLQICRLYFISLCKKGFLVDSTTFPSALKLPRLFPLLSKYYIAYLE